MPLGNREASPLLPKSTAQKSTAQIVPSVHTEGYDSGLVIEDLRVKLGGRLILDGISLTIQPGEFVTVLGSSGSGKTTLLRALMGFVPLAGGTLRLNGLNLTRIPTHQRNIGFVHQQYALFPHLTVAENIAFGLRERHLPRHECQKRVETYLQLIQLESFAEAYPASLSGGMQQRVALARSLAIEPALLLLDEPLSALDANLRVDLRRELINLRRRFSELPFVYVTHDCIEALQLSDRIVLLRNGQIAQVDTPRRMYDEPASLFVARYLGPVNVLPTPLVDSLAQAGHPIASRPGRRWMIRPERVFCGQSAPSPDDDAETIRLTGVARGYEWSGSTRVLHLAIAGHETWELAVLMVDQDTLPSVGETVPARFSLKDCHDVAEGD